MRDVLLGAAEKARIENSLPPAFVLRGGTVVAGERLEVLLPGYIVVQNGIIADVGRGNGPLHLPTVDVTGCVIMPGMINCHTHMEDSALKELSYGASPDVNILFVPDGLRHVRIREMAHAELVTSMRRAARRMLATGTIAVADYRTGGVPGIVSLREAFAGLPIRCLAFASHSTYPVQSDSALAENIQGLSSAQLEEIEEALELADGFAPVHVNHTTDAALRQISQIVHERGKLLSTHASASVDYREKSLARTGNSDVTRAVEHLRPDFVVHMTTATDPELEEVVRADIPIVMCPRSMASLGRPIPPYTRAISLGAAVALGTDNVMMSSPDLLDEMAFLSRVARATAGTPDAVSARTILASVTIEAAKALSLDDTLGSISIGKSASVVIVDFTSDNLCGSVNPIASLVDRATPADIKAVLVEGELANGGLAVQGS